MNKLGMGSLDAVLNYSKYLCERPLRPLRSIASRFTFSRPLHGLGVHIHD